MPWKEERFTSPGTWTWPGVAKVEVIVVGGGGGGGAKTPFPGWDSGGGGGGVKRSYTPVSGPVPITVGAGGAAIVGPTYLGALGGSTTFGSGPTAITADGGGGGGGDAANPGADAPANGGGGGGIGLPVVAGIGGLGYPGASRQGGGMAHQLFPVPNGIAVAKGYYGFGAGGSPGAVAQNSTGGGAVGTTPAVANTGGGGFGPLPGASGIVVVRWFE